MYRLFYNYTKHICLNYSKVIILDIIFSQIDIVLEDLKENYRQHYSFYSPFGKDEDCIINNAFLQETNDSYHLIELHMTAKSGEKKTVKIRIEPSKKSAFIVE